ncbi:hypothetical protein M501DRAFT_950654, partial [Patellaria atrata CBS 101060]
MNELSKAAPNLVPKPHAWGRLNVSHPNTYYFLCDFIKWTDQNPDSIQLCAKLVKLHKYSKSPTNMFGFHIVTLRGNLSPPTTWNSSWVEFSIQLLRGAVRLDQQINGTWKNLGHHVGRLITHLVPQVLGPLVADTRSVKPSLIHRDLWDGNIKTGSETGEVCVFDASAYCAH